jgi:hypothetical protein
MRKPAIVAACIAALGVVVAAIIQIYPSLRTPNPENISITGIVVDRATNQGIGQAAISVVGRAEQYVTEDNGNFRISLFVDKSRPIRLHVMKPGYFPSDQSVQAPADNLVLQLRKQ